MLLLLLRCKEAREARMALRAAAGGRQRRRRLAEVRLAAVLLLLALRLVQHFIAGLLFCSKDGRVAAGVACGCGSRHVLVSERTGEGGFGLVVAAAAAFEARRRRPLWRVLERIGGAGHRAAEAVLLADSGQGRCGRRSGGCMMVVVVADKGDSGGALAAHELFHDFA